MGDVTRVLITGATGFVGRATVAEAEASGLHVVAIGRRDVDLSAPTASEDLRASIQGCQAVIHLAAAMGRDADEHQRVTIKGTRALLGAMETAGVQHLVLISSLACYALEAVAKGDFVRSDTALDSPASARDAYTAAKLEQEMLAREAGLGTLTVLRPGIVYDDTHLWNAHLGVVAGPLFLRFPRRTVLPMCHVDRLAKEIVGAAKTPASRAQMVCDAELPTRGMMIDRLRKSGWSKTELPFAWGFLRSVAAMLSPISDKLPGLLRTRVLEQRLYPMGRISADGTWRAEGGA